MWSSVFDESSRAIVTAPRAERGHTKKHSPASPDPGKEMPRTVDPELVGFGLTVFLGLGLTVFFSTSPSSAHAGTCATAGLRQNGHQVVESSGADRAERATISRRIERNEPGPMGQFGHERRNGQMRAANVRHLDPSSCTIHAERESTEANFEAEAEANRRRDQRGGGADPMRRSRELFTHLPAATPDSSSRSDSRQC